MAPRAVQHDAKQIAAAIIAEIEALAAPDAPSMRAVRCKYSRAVRKACPDLVLETARRLCRRDEHRWLAYELIRYHPAAFKCLDKVSLEELGQGINSWWTVDAFARILSGPAWLQGQVSDQVILKWARSEDRWWRRAALVSTVALNSKASGGTGDTPRTLRVCRVLAKDQDEMVVKGLSWALRQLTAHDAGAARDFLRKHQQGLAALVKREVNNKLRTGLKNPRSRHR